MTPTSSRAQKLKLRRGISLEDPNFPRKPAEPIFAGETSSLKMTQFAYNLLINHAQPLTSYLHGESWPPQALLTY